MKTCSKCNQDKELNDFYKSSRKKDGHQPYCKNCLATVAKTYYHDNINECRDIRKQYHKINAARSNAIHAKRRAAKLNATPPWLTGEHLAEIRQFYETAKELQWLSEEPLVVDHIEPLQGKISCGLHVPWNLQIIGRSENIRKSNKLKIT